MKMTVNDGVPKVGFYAVAIGDLFQVNGTTYIKVKDSGLDGNSKEVGSTAGPCTYPSNLDVVRVKAIALEI